MKALSAQGSAGDGPFDVRAALWRGLDLTAVHTALDLGCGIGFVAEAIARRTATDAEFVGIDSRSVNAQPFMQAVQRTGRRGIFRCERLVDQLDFATDAFDLAVASNSLYFFPALLPQIARVVRPSGVFLAATASVESCRQLLSEAGLGGTASRLLEVIHRFSAENAAQLLRPHFGRIECVEERGTLVFERSRYDDFLRYLWFRLPFLAHEELADHPPAAPLAETLRRALGQRQRIEFARHDVVFRCYEPRSA